MTTATKNQIAEKCGKFIQEFVDRLELGSKNDFDQVVNRLYSRANVSVEDIENVPEICVQNEVERMYHLCKILCLTVHDPIICVKKSSLM